MRARRQGPSGNHLPSTCCPFFFPLNLYFLRVQRVHSEKKICCPASARVRKLLLVVHMLFVATQRLLKYRKGQNPSRKAALPPPTSTAKYTPRPSHTLCFKSRRFLVFSKQLTSCFLLFCMIMCVRERGSGPKGAIVNEKQMER